MLARWRNVVTKYKNLNIKLPDKYKGGRIEKIWNYWEALYLDYKQVAVDVVKEAKEKPTKTVFISGSIAFFFHAFKTNPDENSFTKQLVSASNDIALINDTIRNQSSYEHVTYLYQCDNQRLLRRLNLLCFSLLFRDYYCRDSAVYVDQCPYLKPSYFN